MTGIQITVFGELFFQTEEDFQESIYFGVTATKYLIVKMDQSTETSENKQNFKKLVSKIDCV